MQFAAPWMLIGLALCAIPILIHLLFRRRHRTEPWAAMRFLRAAIQQRSRQTRLESLLLMFVRTLLILMVVLALAEPMLRSSVATLQAREPVHHVLILDASASMSQRQEGARRYDRALEQVERVLQHSVPGDAFHLVRIANSAPRAVIRRATFDPDDVRDELRRWGATEEFGDVAASLQPALELINQTAEPVRKEILLLTDLQQSNWLPDEGAGGGLIPGLLQEIARKGTLTIIDVGAEVESNAAVADLRPTRRFLAPNQSVEIAAIVRNLGRGAVVNQLEWRVDGVLEHAAPIELPPGGETRASLTATARSTSDLVVEARLADEDGFALDNRRIVAIPVRPALRVLLVDGRPSTRNMQGAADFVRLALAPPAGAGPESLPQSIPIEPWTISDVELPSARLEEFDCIWLCDVSSIDSATAARLRRYVDHGGGLVVSLGDQTDIAAYNERLVGGNRGLLPARLEETVDRRTSDLPPLRFEPAPLRHSMLDRFEGNPDAGLSTTIVAAYVRATPLDEARTALHFTSGDPAIVEHILGSGRVVLVLTSADDRWGSWAVWPSFVPMTHEIISFAAAGADGIRELKAGEAYRRRFSPTLHELTAALTSPDGREVPLHVQCDQFSCSLRADQTGALGAYRLELGPPLNRREAFAVNLDPRESLPGRMDEGAIKRRLLPGLKFELQREWTSPPDQALSLAAPGSMATPLLIAAAALLVIDQLMAWRMAAGVWALLAACAAMLVHLTWSVSAPGGAALLVLFAAAAVLAWHRCRLE
jgi:hypothetical protein